MQEIEKEITRSNTDNLAEAGEYIREGQIIVKNGPQRSGKTLGGCIWALNSLHQKRKIYSTIEFKFKHTPLDFYHLRLEDNANELVNSHIFIDELNFYLDARAAMSKVNREFSKFLLQSKKQGVLLSGTTHALSYLELRFRQNYDFIINCAVYPKYPAVPEILTMNILNGPLQEHTNKTVTINVKPYLGLYNTRHVYNPFQSFINEADASVQPNKEKETRPGKPLVRTGVKGLSSLREMDINSFRPRTT